MTKVGRFLTSSLLLGTALRVVGLGAESLWLDEASTARRAALTYAELFFDTRNGSQLPLYFWISKAWSGIAGTGEVSLRFPALIFGVLLIPMVFLLGRELFGERAAGWAAFFAAINPVLIHYSQDARPYSLYVLLVVGSWFYLIRWIRGGERRHLLGWCISTVGVLYTHPLGVLVLPSHLAGFLLFPRAIGMEERKPRFKVFLGSMFLVVLPYLPLLFRMQEQIALKMTGGSVAGWIPTPRLYDLLFTPVWYFTRRAVAGLVALSLLIALAIRPPPSEKNRCAILFLATAWLTFSLLPWAVSFLITPMYVFRYTMPVLAALLILLGWAMTRLRPSIRVGAVALFLAASAGPLYDFHTGMDKPPWRDAGQFLRERSRPGDLVVWDPGYLKPLSEYYFNPPESVNVSFPYSVESVVAALRGVDRVWVVTETGFDFGVASAFLEGDIPGWSVLEERALEERYKVNIRAVSYSEVVVRGFEHSF